MKATEVIVKRLLALGVDHFFLITGGAIAPLVDAISNETNATMLAFQHEQAAIMAAEGYWRESGKMAAVIVTSGPGVQNTFNGLCGCFYDTVPVLLICGQVNTVESLDSLVSKPRQRGFQEMPVVECFSHFCVYTKKIASEHDRTALGLCEALSAAVKAATTPRFGPAVIDLPVNIQMSDVGAIPPLPSKRVAHEDPSIAFEPKKLMEARDLLLAAQRPLFLFGAGVRAARAVSEIKQLVRQLNIPFLLSWGAKDLFPHDDALNIGSPGVYGSRAANIAVQNCDILFIIGSRLDSRQTGGRLDLFSQASKKIMVDIDADEIGKLGESGIPIALSFVCELSAYLAAFLPYVKQGWAGNEAWTSALAEWRARYAKAEIDAPAKYDVATDVHGPMSVYTFLERLDEKIPLDASIVPDQGGNLCWSMQTLTVKGEQRLYTNLGNSSMGFAGPCTIGTAVAARETGRPVVCIDGDGGYLMNIRTISHQHPVKARNPSICAQLFP